MNIDVEKILSRRIQVFPENASNGMTSEAIRRNVKAAIKEIVEAVIDKCAEEGRFYIQNGKTLNSFDLYQKNDFKIQVDKDSILNVKTQITY